MLPRVGITGISTLPADDEILCPKAPISPLIVLIEDSFPSARITSRFDFAWVDAATGEEMGSGVVTRKDPAAHLNLILPMPACCPRASARSLLCREAGHELTDCGRRVRDNAYLRIPDP